MTIQELLQEYHIDYVESGHHHSRPGWIQLKSCPFCSSSNYHLGYRLDSKYCNCWKCSYHSAWSVFTKFGIPGPVIKAFLGSLQTHYTQAVDVRGTLEEPSYRGPLLKAHKDYLRARGLNVKQLVQLWNVEGIGIAPAPLAWRVYIPIEFQHKRVSWTSRAIGQEVTRRYHSAPAKCEAVNHKRICYGLDYCTQSVVICEGPVDVWKIGPGAVGTFGTSYSTAQVRLLSAFPYRFVCFDSSKDAQAVAVKLAHELSAFAGETQNIVLDAKDPGEATQKEIALLRKVARL